MDCLTVRRDELAAGYLRAALDEATAHAYEEHVFECDDCFAELRALKLVREELERRRGEVEADKHRRGPGRWGLVAAAAVVVTAGIVLLIQFRGGGSAASRAQALAELARVSPPSYTPVRLRGSEDDAARLFTEAMEAFAAGDWEGALPGLREAAALDPEAPHVHFYLGATALLADRTDEAVAALRVALRLGDTPFVEEAHYYLALALLRKGDLAGARAELQRVDALAGDRREEARRLIEAIGMLGRR